MKTEKETAQGEEIRLRPAAPGDAVALCRIYAPYVEKTAITFEYEIPTAEEFARRIHHTLERYPYLVAEREGKILAYAYAGPLKERAAYDWAAELSVYVDPAARHLGLGRLLYEKLEEILKEQNVRVLYACITSPREEDEYLTRNSEQFHAHMGFTLAGTFHHCGYKFGRWYDVIWMEKEIGERLPDMPAFVPWPELAFWR